MFWECVARFGRIELEQGAMAVPDSIFEPQTVLDAIRLKRWNFEPHDIAREDYEACGSMPGTPDKISILAERVRRGLPLWHPADRQDCEAPLE